VFCDDAGRVVGFGGLAVVPMSHRFVVDGTSALHLVRLGCAVHPRGARCLGRRRAHVPAGQGHGPPHGWSAEQVGLLMAGVVAVGNLIKTIWPRGQVTPVALPRDDEGRTLVVRGRRTATENHRAFWPKLPRMSQILRLRARRSPHADWGCEYFRQLPRCFSRDTARSFRHCHPRRASCDACCSL
jgi:hypothetical protein